MDWIPRTIRQKQKKIDAVIKEMEVRYGRTATDEEIAEGLGITSDEYLDWQSQMKITNVVSLNEFLEQGSEVSNEASHTKKEKKVILLYYYEDLTLKEISSILEVSESRISQLHTRALQKMKVKLGNYIGILTEAGGK